MRPALLACQNGRVSSPEPSATLSASAQAARVIVDEPNALPRVFGRYVLFDRIGRGGMADIFLARADLALGGSRLCVLKQVLPALSHDPQFEQLLIAEAKLAARLMHGNIVQVLDLGREDDRLFIVMEYVEGFDLNQLLRALSREKRGLPLEFAVMIVREILRGLDYAHRLKDEDGLPLGLVHRDVSPSNVLISFEGEVKLCDFGIARAFSAQAGEAVGAPDDIPPQARIAGKSAYMAPEHARGEEIDARADVFAAGIVLWELCAGRRMYRGNDAEMLALARVGSVPPLPTTGLPSQPMLEQLLARALAPDRDARFPTAQAFLDALEDYAVSARIVPSQLRLGSFLIESVGQRIVEVRRERELSVRALSSSAPPSSMTRLPGAASTDSVRADAHTLGVQARRWREPGARVLPRSQERRLDSMQIPLAEHVPEALAEGDITEYELERTLIGLDILARETLAESVARREAERTASSALSGPSSALPLPSTSLLLPSEIERRAESAYLARELSWYALALGILLLGVLGYLLS